MNGVIEWLQQPTFNLPNWAWVLIALALVILIIVIIVVSVKSKKRRSEAGQAAADPVADEIAPEIEEKSVVEDAEEQPTRSVKEDKGEEKPAEFVNEEKTEEKLIIKEEEMKEKKSEPAKAQPEAKPAAAAKTDTVTKATPEATDEKKATLAKPAAEKKEGNRPKVYHISLRKSDGMWQVKAAGAEKAIKLFRTQAEAIEYCKPLAVNQEANIMIHKKDGSFRKLTY